MHLYHHEILISHHIPGYRHYVYIIFVTIIGVYSRQICDGVLDCRNGEDERSCHKLHNVNKNNLGEPE